MAEKIDFLIEKYFDKASEEHASDLCRLNKFFTLSKDSTDHALVLFLTEQDILQLTQQVKGGTHEKRDIFLYEILGEDEYDNSPESNAAFYRQIKLSDSFIFSKSLSKHRFSSTWTYAIEPESQSTVPALIMSLGNIFIEDLATDSGKLQVSSNAPCALDSQNPKGVSSNAPCALDSQNPKGVSSNAPCALDSALDTILYCLSNTFEQVNQSQKSSILLPLNRVLKKLIRYYALESQDLEHLTKKIKNFAENVGMVSVLANHYFDHYLTEKKPTVKIFDILCPPICDSKYPLYHFYENYLEGKKKAQGTILAREVVNQRADDMTPEIFANLAIKLADKHKYPTLEKLAPLQVHFLTGSELRKQGLHLFHAVGQGSSHDSRLVVLKYEGDPENAHKIIGIVGKGVTFDTGGLNLKPTGSIENMHLDKGGAAAVLGVMKSMLDTGLKKNVVGILGLAENSIGPEAYKPFSIIKSLSGKTVRVANTDAEGRLILADCLTYVQRKYKPYLIIDLATLTGSCAAALGEEFAGIFGNDQEIINSIIESGKNKYEKCWQLPVTDAHREQLLCADADLNSMGTKYAGSSTAAAFLSNFIETGVRWVHIDIAGPGMTSKKKFWVPENGTGFGVQVVLDFLQHHENI